MSDYIAILLITMLQGPNGATETFNEQTRRYMICIELNRCVSRLYNFYLDNNKDVCKVQRAQKGRHKKK